MRSVSKRRAEVEACHWGAAQQVVAAAERLRGSVERGPCRDAAGWRPRLLAAVIRSGVRSAFTAERQNVGQTRRPRKGVPLKMFPVASDRAEPEVPAMWMGWRKQGSDR
jgi:hypothetical protein